MTLFAALAASAPAFSSALRGRLSLPEALLRFLVIFAALWIACAVIIAVLTGLAPANVPGDAAQMPEMVPGSAGGDR